MFQWQGGGLPSVYWVLQRFRTCGAKQLSGVVFIIKFDQCLSFSLPPWSPLTSGGSRGGKLRAGALILTPCWEMESSIITAKAGANKHFTASIWKRRTFIPWIDWCMFRKWIWWSVNRYKVRNTNYRCAGFKCKSADLSDFKNNPQSQPQSWTSCWWSLYLPFISLIGCFVFKIKEKRK